MTEPRFSLDVSRHTKDDKPNLQLEINRLRTTNEALREELEKQTKRLNYYTQLAGRVRRYIESVDTERDSFRDLKKLSKDDRRTW